MHLSAILETILFASGEPMALKKLAAVSGYSEKEVSTALNELETSLADRGITLMSVKNEYQLGTHPDNARFVEDLYAREFSEGLSRASLETLAIVAYKGPLSRAEIEYIRGVNSSFTLKNLAMRGFVDRVDNPKDARAFLYQISFDFLKYFGLKNAQDLPRYEEFEKE
ncbi:MAG: segregation and condensation protein B [Parcubacteria group bacterium Gr01-1014_33]|nr:MAG: segregation and condensation protein B [Parcubacteria group bacterium Gr01-1014_33]